MILGGNGRFLISSFGWIEHGAFILRDLSTNKVISFPDDGSRYLRLYAVDEDRFFVAGHAPTKDFVHFSLRSFSNPASVIWSLRVTPTTQVVTGSMEGGTRIPIYHLVNFCNRNRWDYLLVELKPDGSGATFGTLPWYNSANFDISYQSLFDVTALPNASHVLVSMQRSSTIVVHDPFTGHPREQFQLADRGGNPVLTVVGNELWTIDYDTFVAVDLSSRQATTKLLLQAGLNNGSQFAGKLFYWKPYHKAVIPRPFSGDVVILDEKHTAIESGVKLGREPLECVVTREGRIVARDWKTGHWLEGNISK